MKPWLWVLLCSIGIFATVPVARTFQQFIYKIIGREFFTYISFFAFSAGLAALLYFFIFKLKIKKASQYIWLFVCFGLYIYFTFQLKAHPEEAIHFLEYGLLSYLFFNAFRYGIRDRTIYVTTVFCVLLVGILDEFFQWMMPGRYWDFKDVGINMLAGGILMLAVWKGIKPKIIGKPVRKISLTILTACIAAALIFLGLCMLNTPDLVRRYTSFFPVLSWLQKEESMIEYGYKYTDPEIGTFYSRFTLEELKELDHAQNKSYGVPLTRNTGLKAVPQEIFNLYNPCTNPFLYEFFIHVNRRNRAVYISNRTANRNIAISRSNIAMRENLIIEKYFGNSMQHLGVALPHETLKELKTTASQWKGNYTSRAGLNIITSFGVKHAWMTLFAVVILVWTAGQIWKRRLNS